MTQSSIVDVSLALRTTDDTPGSRMCASPSPLLSTTVSVATASSDPPLSRTFITLLSHLTSPSPTSLPPLPSPSLSCRSSIRSVPSLLQEATLGDDMVDDPEALGCDLASDLGDIDVLLQGDLDKLFQAATTPLPPPPLPSLSHLTVHLPPN